MERIDEAVTGPVCCRNFLGWHRPILETAVAMLLSERTGEDYDFSALAVVVPTAEAGRKLQAALAVAAQVSDRAVLDPDIMTPEGVLGWTDPAPLLPASDSESLLAWVEVLQALDFSTVRNVFPRPPTKPDFPWALQMAITLRRLLHSLGEAGWSITQATGRFGADFPEQARWAELTLLERRYEANLARSGLQDRNRALARAALSVRPPAGVRKLIVFGVPEPLPIVRMAWERLAQQGLALTICIQAPAELADAFDLWGGPTPAVWTQRPLPLAQPQEQISLLPNPLAQAERLLQLTTEAAGELAIGIVDREILPLAVVKFTERGLPVFNPEGVSFSEQSLAWLLTCWQEILATRSWAAWAQWVRVPAVLDALMDGIVVPPEAEVTTPGAGGLLREADACAAAHLPTTIQDALGALKRQQKLDSLLGQVLQRSIRWVDGFGNEDFAIALTDFLARIYAQVEWPRKDPKTTAFRQASEHLLEKLNDVARAAASLPRRLEPAQMLQLLLRLLRDVRLFPEAADEALELSGWLELPWQTAPHLVIAGLNEGLVPAAVTADAWLPHGMRGMLNLRTNDERFAGDAYRLTALLEQRAAHGSVRMLVGRAASAGEPLQPSRLLLLCPSAELPQRVQELFAEAPEEGLWVPEWQPAWQLQPRLPADWQFTKISATVFQKYLQCPFRYFLEMVLKMQDFDAQKQEMDALDFGNLCHYAFEALAEDKLMKFSTDVARVAAFLKEKAAERVAYLYGNALSVPLLVQRSSIQQRLAAAAPLLVQSRLEGWEIKFVELNVRDLLVGPWLVEGVEISGRIDMIEYHPQLEKWRIIDYKTSAKPTTPAQAHLRPASTRAQAPKPYEAAFVEAATLPDGRRWKNLQLPLYAAALQRHYQQPVEAAYFNLPSATSLVRLSPWPEMNAENLPALAVKCATAIIRCIKDAQFWPPNPRPEFEMFERLYTDDLESAIDPSGLLADAAARRIVEPLLPL